MKKQIISLVLLALVLALFTLPASAELMVGGWENVPCEAGALPEDAQAAFDKALAELDCILCQITPVVPDPVPVWALVYIGADLQGNAKILNVYELYIDKHAEPAD